jgi:hypothetical protein
MFGPGGFCTVVVLRDGEPSTGNFVGYAHLGIESAVPSSGARRRDRLGLRVRDGHLAPRLHPSPAADVLGVAYFATVPLLGFLAWRLRRQEPGDLPRGQPAVSRT